MFFFFFFLIPMFRQYILSLFQNVKMSMLSKFEQLLFLHPDTVY